MKNTKMIILLAVWLLIGCKPAVEPVSTGSVSDLSLQAQNYLGLLQASKTTTAAISTNAAKQSSQSMGAFMTKVGVSSGVSSPLGNEEDPWQECSKTTMTKNPDGSITTVVDYGDSCKVTYPDYTYTMWGKSSYTSKYSNSTSGSVFTNTFYSRVIAENLGGKTVSKDNVDSWLTNSHSTFSGTSTYDTLKHTYASSFSSTDTSSYTYNSVTYVRSGYSKYLYDETKSVVSAERISFKSGNNYYETIVTVPIVTDYSCYPYTNMIGTIGIMRTRGTPVSGHVIVKYVQDGKQGEFEIDFGDGTCDSKVTITENGKTIILDSINMPGLFSFF